MTLGLIELLVSVFIVTNKDLISIYFLRQFETDKINVFILPLRQKMDDMHLTNKPVYFIPKGKPKRAVKEFRLSSFLPRLSFP